MDATFELGDTVTIKWRPDRPVRVDKRMYEAVTRLRSALIVASQRRSTLTYGEASAAIDEIYPARGLGRALDLLSQDCIERKEPSLTALVVQSTSGAVGGGFKGNAQAERERCYKHSGGSSARGFERVQQAHARTGQIGGVACDQRPASHLGRRGQQAIDHRQRIGHVQAPPLLGHLGSDLNDAVSVVPKERGQP